MKSVAERVEAILNRQGVIDGHNDLPWAVRELCDYDLESIDLVDTNQRTQTDLDRLRQGRVAAQFWSVYVPSSLPAPQALVQTLEQIDFVHRMVEANPGHLSLATTAAEVDRAERDGRIACLIGAEGGHSIAESLGSLRMLFRLGVRYLTLTHRDNVSWADSANDVEVTAGLNEFGRDVVGEMNRLGMIVDLSHVSEATMWAALEVSEAPVIFSHSSCRQLVDNPRNVPDKVLEELGNLDGLCMVSFVPDFVSSDCYAWSCEFEQYLEKQGGRGGDADALRQLVREYVRANPRPRATLVQVADHIEHAREVAGVEHIGIGGDYDGNPDYPDGLKDVATYPALFAELVQRGWTDADCERLAGRNAVDLLRRVEHSAIACTRPVAVSRPHATTQAPG